DVSGLIEPSSLTELYVSDIIAPRALVPTVCRRADGERRMRPPPRGPRARHRPRRLGRSALPRPCGRSGAKSPYVAPPTNSPTGRFSRNKARHPHPCATRPPTVGPTAPVSPTAALEIPSPAQRPLVKSTRRSTPARWEPRRLEQQNHL